MTKRPSDMVTRRQLALSRQRRLLSLQTSMTSAIRRSDLATAERVRLRLGSLLVRATVKDWPVDIRRITGILDDAAQRIELSSRLRPVPGPLSTLAAIRSAISLADHCAADLRSR